MVKRSTEWAPGGSDALAIANSRVCLALLRIFRQVPLALERQHYDDLARPLWRAIRPEKRALQKGLQASCARLSQDQDSRPDWLNDALRPGAAVPLDLPHNDYLALLGEGLVRDRPAFRELFDAAERRLERCASMTNPCDQNIATLARLLELNGTEVRFLQLCAALETGTIGGDLFAHVQRGRRYAALQAALGQAGLHDVEELTARDGRLMRSALLAPSSDRISISDDLQDELQLSRLGSALVTGTVRSVEEMAVTVLRPLPAADARPSLIWPHLQSRADLLGAALTQALACRTPGTNVLLYGAPGTGKTEFARQLIGRVGATGYRIDDTNKKQRPASRMERLGYLHLSQIFAPAGQSVLVLDEAEDVFQNDYNNPLSRALGQEQDSKSWMNALLERNRLPVIWISNQVSHIDPAYLRRFTYCLEFPVTPRGVRQTIARSHLEPAGCSGPLIDAVAAEAHLTPALLASAARFVSLSGARGGQADEAARLMLGDHLKAMGHKTSDLALPHSTRFDLQYLNVRGPAQPERILAGLAQLGRGSLLLAGPPGTGKTQLGAEIARRLGRELVYKTASDINTKWYGESERNVARLFSECDIASEVLFLDEADTLLGARESAGQRADRAVTAEFLRHLDSFPGVFVCATNHAAEFDAALMRRFVFRLRFLPLDEDQRQRLLWESAIDWRPDGGAALPALPPDLQPRLQRLDQLTPGDFANVAKRFRSLEIQADRTQWIDELELEQQAKPGAARGAIGFL